ncbi:hypothetical protein GIS00_02395 [Nakamurella sp. YIM 132087]|uniref:Uncharacterized protein n=1 Tax=Nakamurella alba TaxID=2665158 RepID=A0A7K1FIS7_9ACTN|nr:hypothetical protein [Nakamurella alba]MTD12794.1 hypothetical protein [Nakamurella alba]
MTTEPASVRFGRTVYRIARHPVVAVLVVIGALSWLLSTIIAAATGEWSDFWSRLALGPIMVLALVAGWSIRRRPSPHRSESRSFPTSVKHEDHAAQARQAVSRRDLEE